MSHTHNVPKNNKLAESAENRIKKNITIEDATPPRWACHHQGESSAIEAYVRHRDGLEVIARMRNAEGINARANAELVVQAVNRHDKYQPLVTELINALQLCLDSGRLNWEVEQEADVIFKKAKRVMAS